MHARAGNTRLRTAVSKSLAGCGGKRAVLMQGEADIQEDIASQYSFAMFSDNAPSWQELKQLLAETKARLNIPDACLESVRVSCLASLRSNHMG